mmetsp:Transcript_100996/g.308846  ORF Transcript_100996/g.308846 Transcript_100996/m.308846 type:complete len:232 (-) Transcript_100996:152-847(-)
MPIILMPTAANEAPNTLLTSQFFDNMKITASAPPTHMPPSSAAVGLKSRSLMVNKGALTLLLTSATKWSAFVPEQNTHINTTTPVIAILIQSVPKYLSTTNRPKRTHEPMIGIQYASSFWSIGAASLEPGGSVKSHTACFAPRSTHKVAKESKCKFGCRPAHRKRFFALLRTASWCDFSNHSGFCGCPAGYGPSAGASEFLTHASVPFSNVRWCSPKWGWHEGYGPSSAGS